MALFQRNPHTITDNKPLFTLGNNKTVLIVGLGNIGEKYQDTRHNIGFKCLDEFAKTHEFESWIEKKDFKCLMASANLGDTRVILCKPTTMMNLSGEAVQKIAHFYKIYNDQVVVVHDELAIEFGQIRIRTGGSDAGNNGVKSIIQSIGEDFGRVRIGIDGSRPEAMDSADYVLAKFTAKEKAQLDNLTKEVISILTDFVFSGQIPHETRSFLI